MKYGICFIIKIFLASTYNRISGRKSKLVKLFIGEVAQDQPIQRPCFKVCRIKA